MLGLSSLPFDAALQKHKSAKSSLKTASESFKKADKEAKSLRSALEGVPVDNAKQISPVADLFSQLGYDMKVEPQKYGVKVNVFRMNSQMQGDIDLAAVGQPFAKVKNLKVVSVVIEGSFTEYENFKKFLHWFDSYTMSVSSLDIKRNGFSLVLDIYGN